MKKLSEQEIEEILQDGQMSLIYSYELTPEQQEAISLGAKSSSLKLRNMANIFVLNSLSHYILSILRHYGISRKDNDYEDYLQELRMVIIAELPRWNPAYNLTTYFEKLFRNRMTFLFAKNQNFSSVHYASVMIHINKAKDSLRKKGVESPSYDELQKQMLEEGYSHSIQTIKNTLRQDYDMASFEKCAEQGEEDSFLAEFMKAGEDEGESEKITAVLETMKPVHKNIIETERTLYGRPIYDPSEEDKRMGVKKSKRHVVTSPDLLKELVHLYPDINIDWVVRHRSVAESEFAHKYTMMFKSSPEKKVKINI